MNKKVLKKISILIFTFSTIVIMLYTLSSCTGNQQKAIKEATDTFTVESAINTEAVNSESGQIIEAVASYEGYLPENIEAKAGIATKLIIKSEDAYGCERAFNIIDPELKKVLHNMILPENGNTDFDLGIQAKGTELLGICSMGMYYFRIIFN